MKKCGTCTDITSTTSDEGFIIENKMNQVDFIHLQKFLPSKPLKKKNKPSDHEFVLKNLKPNHWIFYFAALKKGIHIAKLYPKDKAYGNFENSDCVKTNVHGNANIDLDCPQIYINDDEKVYSRHFHFLYWNDENKRWEKQLYTVAIICTINYIPYSKHLRIVDARNPQNYKEFHIPGAINIPYVNINDQTDSTILQKLKTKNKNISIIVYCNSPSCPYALNLIKELNKKGFHNLFYFALGIKSLPIYE
jgi:hypothetical protein